MKELGRLTLSLTGNTLLAQSVAGANTARQALELLTKAGAGGVVAGVGTKLLAALRDYAGPGPGLSALVLDFDGAPLWRGKSHGAGQPRL